MQLCKPFRSPGQVAASPAPGASTAGGSRPAATAIGLILFFGYLTFRAFNATYVWYEPVHQPDGGSAAVHAGVRLPGSGAGRARLVRRVPGVVAGVPAAVAGVLHARARHRVPLHLLLLPRRLLQGLRVDAAVLRGARPATALPRRDGAAAVPEPASLHAVRRAVPARVPLVGGPRRVLPRRPVRHRRRHRGHADRTPRC